jgi:hypothetical protein
MSARCSTSSAIKGEKPCPVKNSGARRERTSVKQRLPQKRNAQLRICPRLPGLHWGSRQPRSQNRSAKRRLRKIGLNKDQGCCKDAIENGPDTGLKITVALVRSKNIDLNGAAGSNPSCRSDGFWRSLCRTTTCISGRRAPAMDTSCRSMVEALWSARLVATCIRQLAFPHDRSAAAMRS